MFGRGKRKSQKEEEEDLLVPHGLIWQATDEPRQTAESDPRLPNSEAAVVSTPSLDATPPAISVVAPSRVSNTQPPPLAPTDDARPARLGVISPPILWPSPKTASMIRRIPPPTASPVLPSETIPSLTKPQKQLQPLLHHAPSARQPNEVEVVDLTTTAQPAESSPPRETLAQVLQSLGQQVGTIHRAISGFLAQMCGTTRDAYQSMNLRSRLPALKLAKDKWVGTVSSRSRLAGQSFRHGWRSNLARMARMQSALGRSSSATGRSSLARSANLARRLRNHKFRIRIVKSAGAHALIMRSRRAWADRAQAIRREPRLWISMMMAAFSAMLTLGVISAVSHYAPAADASNKAVASPSKPHLGAINPKIVVGPRPRTSGISTEASESTRSIPSRQAKPSLARENGRQRTTTRRTHRNLHEDYVAPDSYHYYGTNGKPR